MYKFNILTKGLLLCAVATGLYACQSSSHQQMIDMLTKLHKRNHSAQNSFAPDVKLHFSDSVLSVPGNANNIAALMDVAPLLLKTGDEERSVMVYNTLLKKTNVTPADNLMTDVGMAYMRLGERTNCMLNHNGSSCVFPIKDAGVHIIKTGSTKAIETYQNILKSKPDDLESRWLLNIAYMTLGGYPDRVPAQYLIPGLDNTKGANVRPFTDMAADLGLNINGRAGGVIAEDFDNDGYLDLITSGWELNDPMHYFKNNQDGTFTDVTATSGLKGINGGLNIQQTDYDNDGYKDIFVMRGAWNAHGFGDQPSSLLHNNGDGTFTDVTISAGLLFFHPTQAAVWADFNNDGWLDVFIGFESPMGFDQIEIDESKLFINNHDGTFTDVADKAHCNIVSFIKGVTAADYDNDGWPDIFASTLDGRKFLLKNKGKAGAIPDFEDVSEASGVAANRNGTFTTWFFDYNNDGWPDIMAADYRFTTSLAYYAAAAALGKPEPGNGNIYLFRNNRNGTFTEVTKQAGLDKVVFSMGANFGDIDNDGYPDMYFGSGNPDFKSLVPNKMFRNVNGERFEDVTISSRTGNLQKGHGVAFADFRNTGIQDIFAEMGGAVIGDSYRSSLYVNPGQNNNNWISLKLEGTIANSAAIGSRIKITFTDNGVKRSVYKDVNSGGSFGSSPLAQEIGVGQAKILDDIEIKWAGSKTVQHFKSVAVNQFLHIVEGKNQTELLHLRKAVFKKKDAPLVCMPMAVNTARNH
ncbi:CRTAC1 family protein [Mucilaginibacter conchicola]|uniref:CRTAC1 family protein n=1 Tax=Mucilaginibacter conchicola TaxID=2303333 RepID=A0A372NRA2_9SPHI|nr:CRTAC1 family protein [Mucilaginibacter conchicola]RFZ91796.1 CRTAC1 family protein [Mucilaginibacter conchicola]